MGRRSNPTNLGALENLELLVVISVLVLIALSVIIYLAFQFKTRSNEIDEMTKKKWKIIEKDIMTMMIDRSTSWFLKRMGRILLISIDIWWTLTTTLYWFFFCFFHLISIHLHILCVWNFFQEEFFMRCYNLRGQTRWKNQNGLNHHHSCCYVETPIIFLHRLRISYMCFDPFVTI